MTKFFMYLFCLMGIVGIAIGATGGAIISFGMVLLVCYASRVFAAQDAAYMSSPCSACKPLDTLELLDQHGSEGSRVN